MQHIYFDLPEHRMIFIATPHCASDALCQALAPLLPEATKKDVDRWGKQVLSKQDVVRLKPDRLVIATVRNPWDRVATQFDALVQVDLGAGVAAHGFASDMDFAAFVGHLAKNRNVFDDPALSTQAQLLFDSDNKLLPDLVLRYERLEDDYKMLAALVASRTGVELPALALQQAETGSDFAARYTRPPRIMVRDIYNQDVNFFYYHFPQATQADTAAA